MRFRPQNLPPAFGLEVLDERAGEVRRLYAEHDERRKLATEAEFAVERAEQSDAEARAAAIRAGKTSKPNAAEKARKALGDARREEAAYAEAVKQAEADLLAALQEHGGELRECQHQLQRAARDGMRSALDELEENRAELAGAQALVEWLNVVESGGIDASVASLRPAPTGFNPPKFASTLPIPGPNGERLPAATAIAALRTMVAAGEEAPQPERAAAASGGD